MEHPARQRASHDPLFTIAEHAFGVGIDPAERARWAALLGSGTTFYAERDGIEAGSLGVLPASQSVPGGLLVDADLVTWVATLPTHRRQGVMTELVGRVASERWSGDGRPGVAALWASEARIYRRFGFGPATTIRPLRIAPDRLRDDAGLARAAEAAGPLAFSFVQPAQISAEARPIHEAAVVARPAGIRRTPAFWDRWCSVGEFVGGSAAPRSIVAARRPDGALAGWIDYRREVPADDPLAEEGSTCRVMEVAAASPAVAAALWRFVVGLDLVEVAYTPWSLAPDDPLLRVVDDHRALAATAPETWDGLWVRLCDPARVLATRGWQGSGSMVLELDDPMGYASGTWQLEIRDGRAVVEATTAAPDLSLRLDDAAALVFADAPLRELVAASRAAVRSDGVI